MTSTLDWMAVLRGAAVAICICLPAALLAQVLADVPEGDDPPSTVFVFFTLVLVGFAVGGWWAARAAPTAPYSNGAVAALAAFVVIQGIAYVVRAIDGDAPSVVVLVFNALTAYLCGLAGAGVLARQQQKTQA